MSALVVSHAMMSDGFITNNFPMKDVVETSINDDNGNTAIGLITFPAQDGNGEIVFMEIERPFLDFVKTIGPKGTMTVSDILSKYPTLSEAAAETLVEDFAIYQDNYMVIGDTPGAPGATILMSVKPYDLHELMIKPDPIEESEPAE